MNNEMDNLVKNLYDTIDNNLNNTDISTLIMSESFQLVRTPAYDKFNGINLSSEVSYLIKEAGATCEYYASDLYYDLKTLYRDLQEESVLFEKDDYLWVIGIRTMGCDHDYFIASRFANNQGASNYESIYAIKVSRDEDYNFMFNLKMYGINPSALQAAYNNQQ